MFETVMTAIPALGGGFIGAYFTRQTQHHKWLLERRSEAFAKYLQLLDEAFHKATDIFFDKRLGDQRQPKILEAYRQVFTQIRIVRLYLSKDLRNEFDALAKD